MLPGKEEPKVTIPGHVHCGIDVLENAFAGKHAAKSFPEAGSARFHIHVWCHPDHGSFFRDHGFVRFKVADDTGKVTADNFILSYVSPFFNFALGIQKNPVSFRLQKQDFILCIVKQSIVSQPVQVHPFSTQNERYPAKQTRQVKRILRIFLEHFNVRRPARPEEIHSSHGYSQTVG